MHHLHRESSRSSAPVRWDTEGTLTPPTSPRALVGAARYAAASSFRALLVVGMLCALGACGGTQATEVVAATTPEHEDEREGGAVHGHDGGAPDDVEVELLLNHGVSHHDADGLRIIHKPTPGNAIIHVSVFIDGGATTWDPDRAGAAQLAMSVATSGGPDTMDKSTYAAALASMGSSIWGDVTYDYASMSMSSVNLMFDETWALYVQTLLSPAFTESEFTLRRERALAGLRTEMDDADSAVVEHARRLLFEGHPYATRTQGSEETITALDRDELVDAYTAMLDRDRMTLVVVGDLDAEAFVARVRQDLAPLPSRGAQIPPTPPTFSPSERMALEQRPGSPTAYVLGYFGAPSPDHPDYSALSIALSILSDRLFEEVRTRRNLSYAVAAGMGARRANSGYLYVTATDPTTTVHVIFDTIDDLIENPIDASELDAQVEKYLTELYITLQSNSAQASLLGRWSLLTGSTLSSDLNIARMRALTPDDISTVLDRYIRDVRFAVLADDALLEALDTNALERR